MDTQSNERSTPQETQKAVTIWLQQNAMPFQYVEAGNGFSDLQPLKQMLKDVKLVGLGETTHGTREMFQRKHRLLEFLVMEMDFDSFAIEASFAACQPINDYLLYGIGDRAAVLTGQWYVPWDTEEISAMLDWLRVHNQNVPDEKKVKFYGVDITRNELGTKAVLDYLRKVVPDRLADSVSNLTRDPFRRGQRYLVNFQAIAKKSHSLQRLQNHCPGIYLTQSWATSC